MRRLRIDDFDTTVTHLQDERWEAEADHDGWTVIIGQTDTPHPWFAAWIVDAQRPYVTGKVVGSDSAAKWLARQHDGIAFPA